MKSAGNEGVVQSRLQMLHIHVLLVAPLRACYMAEPRTDQHRGGVSIRERPYHAGPAADLTVQMFNHIVGADTCLVFTREAAVGQRFSLFIPTQILSTLAWFAIARGLWYTHIKSSMKRAYTYAEVY